MDSQYEYQKLPSVQRLLNEIRTPEDRKVRVVGTIVSKDDSSFLLDDGSGSARVVLRADELQRLQEKQVVRVIGSPSSGTSPVEIRADIVQDMTKLNTKFYKAVHQKWKQFQ